MTHEAGDHDLTALRSAITDLVRVFFDLADSSIDGEWFAGQDFCNAITETLELSVAKGDTNPNQIAQRILNLLKEVQK